MPLNEDADPLDAVRASLARTAALTQETMEEAPPTRSKRRSGSRPEGADARARGAGRAVLRLRSANPGRGGPINAAGPVPAARRRRRLRRQRSAVVDVSRSRRARRPRLLMVLLTGPTSRPSADRGVRAARRRQRPPAGRRDQRLSRLISPRRPRESSMTRLRPRWRRPRRLSPPPARCGCDRGDRPVRA